MPPTAAIIIPTRDRARYLDVALASIVPQAAEAGAEILVVDDGPSELTRTTAERHGARYLPAPAPGGLNLARNAAIDATSAELLVYVDDDVRVHPGWLAALIAGADSLPATAGVFTGPIIARFEDHRFRTCGREDPPITTTDLGDAAAQTAHAWGANMTIRRSAFEQIGRFDEGGHLTNGGDEQEWQDRWRAIGGTIHYLPGASLDHRRADQDARLRSLCRAAYHRGRAGRRFDVFKREQPSTAAELRTLAGCIWHGPRRVCMNGPVLAAHSLGRIRELAAEWNPRHVAPPAVGTPDFLAGTSGTVSGRRVILREIADRRLDRRGAAHRRALLRQARATSQQRRVLVIGVERPEVANTMAASHAELTRSQHTVEVRTAHAADRGKFANLNRLLLDVEPDRFDWLLVVDDDVDLPAGFLDIFLLACESAGLKLAQPAQRLSSHAAWDITRRRDGEGDWRETTFVEIGPVTAFHRDTFRSLLPFPDLQMGWGLDVHWSAVARAGGWPIGIVDAVPIGHTLRPVADTYRRDDAIDEARAFLATRPYVRRDQVGTVRTGRITT